MCGSAHASSHRRDRSVCSRSRCHKSQRLAGQRALEAIIPDRRDDPCAHEEIDVAAGESHCFGGMSSAGGGCAAKDSSNCGCKAAPQQLADDLVARRSVRDADVAGQAEGSAALPVEAVEVKIAVFVRFRRDKLQAPCHLIAEQFSMFCVSYGRH